MIAKILSILLLISKAVFWYLEALYRQIIPPPLKSIDGETILVTGCCGGIGKEICRYLVKSGSNLKLVLWDLNLKDIQKFSSELLSLGSSNLKVFPFQVDLSSRENIDQVCVKTKQDVGPITIVFNNAGTSAPGNFLDITPSQMEKVLQVNLLSHLWILRNLLPDMLKTDHGRIVNICSMGGLSASAYGLPYYSSKYGVNGYSDALRCELLHSNSYGVKVSTVYPYFVKTPLIGSLICHPENKTSLPKTYHRFQEPEEVAKKVVDGMRREYEYIYCPGDIPLVLLRDFFTPMKWRKAQGWKHLISLIYTDPKDIKTFTKTYKDVLAEKLERENIVKREETTELF